MTVQPLNAICVVKRVHGPTPMYRKRAQRDVANVWMQHMQYSSQFIDWNGDIKNTKYSFKWLNKNIK